jgi:3-hydroxyisobutyrate dehydrogenase-like beta-hydroxyacid dehydrogenase
MPRRIGILHPGQMGSAVAASMRNGGNEVYWASEGRSQNTRERASELGLIDAMTVANMCETCSAIVSVCPPEFADAVADQVRSLSFRGLFVDANAISPERVKRMAHGMKFVDAGIIGLPPAPWVYFSGAVAAEAAALFDAGPIKTEVIAGEIGKASALKMCFAGYNKGTSALLCAILALADQLEVRELLEEQWKRMPGSPANPAKTVASVAPKAWRFAPEMQEIAATFEAAGLPPGFHQAAARIYADLAAFKDKSATADDVARALVRAASALVPPPPASENTVETSLDTARTSARAT